MKKASGDEMVKRDVVRSFLCKIETRSSFVGMIHSRPEAGGALSGPGGEKVRDGVVRLSPQLFPL